MNLKGAIIILVLLLTFPCFIMGQSNAADHKVNIEVPEVALLGLISDGSSDISFIASSSGEAGNSVSFADMKQSKNIWINYSSIVSDNVPARKVVASVQGEMPAGMELMVQASRASGAGSGKLGQPVGMVKLSNEPTDVIVDIGSCFTGRGLNNGHYLSYQLNFDPTSEEYSQLMVQPVSFNVVYTLTDRN